MDVGSELQLMLGFKFLVDFSSLTLIRITYTKLQQVSLSVHHAHEFSYHY